MSVEREEEQPDEKSFDEEAERERSDEAPWETQDQPHEGEEGQSEEVA